MPRRQPTLADMATLFESAKTIGTFRKTVTSAGTAEQLDSNECRRVIVQALSDNTNPVEVGDSNVVAAEGTQRGMRLFPTQSAVFSVNNTDLLYVDSVTNGEGISVTYEN